jgi:hypothetical protein
MLCHISDPLTFNVTKFGAGSEQQCEVSVGPLPQGGYTLGNMYTFKGMPYCYDLYPDSSNNMCGRSGFLIHGGGCSGNPSEGCIVIEDENTRYKIKSGARLTVVG